MNVRLMSGRAVIDPTRGATDASGESRISPGSNPVTDGGDGGTSDDGAGRAVVVLDRAARRGPRLHPTLEVHRVETP